MQCGLRRARRRRRRVQKPEKSENMFGLPLRGKRAEGAPGHAVCWSAESRHYFKLRSFSVVRA